MKKIEFVLIIAVGTVLVFYAGTLALLGVLAFGFRKNIFKMGKNILVFIKMRLSLQRR